MTESTYRSKDPTDPKWQFRASANFVGDDGLMSLAVEELTSVSPTAQVTEETGTMLFTKDEALWLRDFLNAALPLDRYPVPAPTLPPPPVYFVSGHLDLTTAEFAEHYAPRLRVAVMEGASFVVGDARGADQMTQSFLAETGVPRARVTVFHMFDKPRHHVDEFPTQGGYETDDARDAAMTAASTRDIAWVRPGREKSGTARNLARRGG